MQRHIGHSTSIIKLALDGFSRSGVVMLVSVPGEYRFKTTRIAGSRVGRTKSDRRPEHTPPLPPPVSILMLFLFKTHVSFSLFNVIAHSSYGRSFFLSIFVYFFLHYNFREIYIIMRVYSISIAQLMGTNILGILLE